MKSYAVRPELQRAIVPSLAEGLMVKEIADRMGYTHSSVETYILRIRKEYGARNITHLVHIWHSKGMLNTNQNT